MDYLIVARRSWKSIMLSIAACLALIFSFLTYYTNTELKVGYVRSKDLMTEYAAMKEARKISEDRNRQWESEIDTLQSDYRRTVATYANDYSQLDAEERSRREELLRKQEENIREYTQVVYEKSQQSEHDFLQKLYDQINITAEEFGKENDYDLILGTSESGSIIYGDKAIDVTEDLLKLLNDHYRSGSLSAEKDSLKQ